jgi:hypothetical protein
MSMRWNLVCGAAVVSWFGGACAEAQVDLPVERGQVRAQLSVPLDVDTLELSATSESGETTTLRTSVANAGFGMRAGTTLLTFPPGSYTLSARALDDAGARCAPAVATAAVLDAATTEVELTLACDAAATGVADDAVLPEMGPLITALRMSGEGIVRRCEPLDVAVEAFDPDGDPLSVTFELRAPSTPGTVDLVPRGEMGARFRASEAGAYEVAASATDARGLQARVAFTVHVSSDKGAIVEPRACGSEL